MRPSFDVIYEDNHLLIVDKPAGLPTMGVATGKPSLLEEAKAYIGWKYDKPGNVYLGVVSRLDAPVTGVLVIARTSKAAKRLTEQFRRREVEKSYWALVSPPPEESWAACEDWVRKDERRRKMHIAMAESPGAQEARLSYRTLKTVGTRSLLEVQLETGRKHQIRLQLGSRGFPVIGDRKYGSTVGFPQGIALHARRIVLNPSCSQYAARVRGAASPSWGKARDW